MLIDNAGDDSFKKDCQFELELLSITKELLLNNFLVWFIPLVQIREDYKEGMVFKRML